MKLLRTNIEWVAQVSLLRPGFLLANGPGRNKERSVVEGPAVPSTRNHSNLGHPSPLVIPTRISYFALLATTTCAALRKESRMQIIKTTGLDRISGGTK